MSNEMSAEERAEQRRRRKEGEAQPSDDEMLLLVTLCQDRLANLLLRAESGECIRITELDSEAIQIASKALETVDISVLLEEEGVKEG
ncbi:MAG: hypothetical protein DRO11_08955 [Methanobacteriota archaeon]|nr:MAG: hypothetical protein DRO11_08955 [Euryarchaeota archaeon]